MSTCVLGHLTPDTRSDPGPDPAGRRRGVGRSRELVDLEQRTVPEKPQPLRRGEEMRARTNNQDKQKGEQVRHRNRMYNRAPA